MKKQTVLIKYKDPFRPALNPETSIIRAGTRVDTLLKKELLVKNKKGPLVYLGKFIVTVNGTPILRSEYNTVIKKGDLICIVYLPPKGGGGSNIMNIVMAIVVAATAWVTFGLSLVAAGAIGLGTYALLSLMAPPKLETPSNAYRESASPNYTLSAQNNNARLLEAIPVLYGEFKLYIDLASQPYVENINNNQYLYQLFCITQGEVDTDNMKIFIEDTPIENFSDIEFQVVKPYQQVTLFPDNVVTSEAVQRLELLAPDQPNHAILGPYIVNASDTKANRLAVDVSYPQGAFHVDDGGNYKNFSMTTRFDYQAVDTAGNPIGAWQVLAEHTHTDRTNNPSIKTFFADVPPGRYQVRGVRTTNVGNNKRNFGSAEWVGLRAYLPSVSNYGNVTMLAMVMKANNVLNSNIARRVNVIAQRKLPTWNPVEGWTEPRPTSSIAWAICDALRNPDYGRNVQTSRINMAEVYRLHQVWESRGDKFNGVFDVTYKFWDALSRICNVGRATPIYYASVIDIVRNEPQTHPKQMFSIENILAGSWNVKYIFSKKHETPDHVIGEYVDRETWKPRTVAATLDGTPAEKGYEISWFGITDHDHAWRESISLAAKNRDQRKIADFKVAGEGFLVRYNDLVSVTYPSTGWGQSGVITGINRQAKRIISDTPVRWESGKRHAIGIRAKNGKMIGPFDCSRGANDYEIIVDMPNNTALTMYVSDRTRDDGTFFQFGVVEKAFFKGLIKGAKPNKDGTVTITVVNYADSVYSAENGGVIPTPDPITTLPTAPVYPIVNYVTVQETLYPETQKIIAAVASGASFYEFAYKPDGASDWVSLGTFSDNYVTANLSPGLYTIRARAIGAMPGPWATWQGEIDGLPIPVPDIISASANGAFASIILNHVNAPGVKDIVALTEIWMSATNDIGTASRIAELPYPAATFTVGDLKPTSKLYFWWRYVDKIDRKGNWYNDGVGIVGEPDVSADIVKEYLKGQIDESMIAPELVEEIQTGASSKIVGLLTGEDGTGEGDVLWYAGDDATKKTFVGTKTVTSAYNRVDFAQAKQSYVLAARVDDNAAYIAHVDMVNADARQATALQLTQLAARVNSAEASAEIALQTTASLDEGISSTYQVKLQARTDGKLVQVGYAMGASIDKNGNPRSEFIVQAGLFAVVKSLNGAITPVFAVDSVNDLVYLETAIIKNASIGSAKFTEWLESDSKVNGVPVLRLNFRTGEIQINGSASGTGGRLVITNRLIQVFDENNVRRVRIGIW